MLLLLYLIVRYNSGAGSTNWKL